MTTTSTIAIIGATNEQGIAIAQMLATSGSNLLLMSEDNESLGPLVVALRTHSTNSTIEGIDGLKDACWEADVIFLAVPADEILRVAESVKEVATQKIVVSLNNPSQSEALVHHLPDSRLVFLTIEVPGDPELNGKDAEAVEAIRTLLVQPNVIY